MSTLLGLGEILPGMIALIVPLTAAARYFGEPVQRQGGALYFTGWKSARRLAGNAPARPPSGSGFAHGRRTSANLPRTAQARTPSLGPRPTLFLELKP